MDQPPLDRCPLGPLKPRPTLGLFAAPPKAVIQNGLNETTGSSTDVAKKNSDSMEVFMGHHRKTIGNT